MNRSLCFSLGALLLFLGCDSFPKKMHSERVGAPLEKDQIKISAECNELTNPYPLPEVKNSIILKLYVVNSSPFPIEFSPANMVSAEQESIDFIYARGAREASKKEELPKDRTLVVNAGEDYLIDLSFGLKNEEQLQKAVFKISGVSIGEKKRPAESFICMRSKTKN